MGGFFPTLLHNLPLQDIECALHTLTECTRATDPACKHQRSPGKAFYTRLHPTSCNKRLDEFWTEWDRVAKERRVLLEKRRVD